MFWDNFTLLCKERGTTPNAVAKQLGYSSAICTHWKNGKTPSGKKLTELSNFFGITVEYLLSGNSPYKMPDAPPNDPNAAYKMPERAERLGINENTPRVVPTRSALSEELDSLTEEEYKEVENFVDYLKHKRCHSSANT